MKAIRTAIVLGTGVLAALHAVFADADAPKPRSGSTVAPPSTYSEAEALYAAAIKAYPVSGLDDLGRPGRSFEAARVPLETILREHPSMDRAPAAGLLLGYLQMDPANPRADLDLARRSFLELVRIAPRAPEAPAALEAAALCLRLQGQPEAAAALDVRLLTEHATDPASVRARLRLARAGFLAGDGAAAARLLPTESADPSASAPARALGAFLARAAEDRPQSPGSREVDVDFPSPSVKDPISLAATVNGALVLEKDAGGRIVRTDGTWGDPPPGAENWRGLSVDPRGGVWTWDEKGVTPPDGARIEPRGQAGKDGQAEPVRKIVAVAPGLIGTFDVIDASGPQVLRYGPGSVLRGVVALPARPLAAARGEDGTLDVLLATRPRQVLEIHAGPPVAAGWPAREATEPAQGWVTSSIALQGPEWELGSPVAIARDGLGRVYLLDEDTRSVTVFDAEGRRVATIATPKGNSVELRAPTAVAVDASGLVYVVDRKLGRIVRFK